MATPPHAAISADRCSSDQDELALGSMPQELGAPTGVPLLDGRCRRARCAGAGGCGAC